MSFSHFNFQLLSPIFPFQSFMPICSSSPPKSIPYPPVSSFYDHLFNSTLTSFLHVLTPSIPSFFRWRLADVSSSRLIPIRLPLRNAINVLVAQCGSSAQCTRCPVPVCVWLYMHPDPSACACLLWGCSCVMQREEKRWEGGKQFRVKDVNREGKVRDPASQRDHMNLMLCQKWKHSSGPLW